MKTRVFVRLIGIVAFHENSCIQRRGGAESQARTRQQKFCENQASVIYMRYLGLVLDFAASFI